MPVAKIWSANLPNGMRSRRIGIQDLSFRGFSVTLTKPKRGSRLQPDPAKRPNVVRAVFSMFAATLCIACGGGADAAIGPPPPSAPFTIDVRILSEMTPSQRDIVRAAVTRWTRALSKSLGEFRFKSPADDCFRGQPAMDETHHTQIVFVTVGEIDGFNGGLAGTRACAMSARDTLPLLTHIQLDRVDLDGMERRGILLGVMTHELGHALGFNPLTYGPRKLAEGGTSDPYINGRTARAEFGKHGAWYTGVTVPLENQSGGGPNDPHWRLFVFGDEVMSSAISSGYKSPLSVITLGLFQDMGYTVDFSAADAYEVRPLFGDNRLVPEFTFMNDVSRIPPRAFLTPIVRE